MPSFSMVPDSGRDPACMIRHSIPPSGIPATLPPHAHRAAPQSGALPMLAAIAGARAMQPAQRHPAAPQTRAARETRAAAQTRHATGGNTAPQARFPL